MRYMVFSHNVSKIKYIFAAYGMPDSDFLHQVLCLLDFDEYTVKITDKEPRQTKTQVWFFGNKDTFKNYVW